jgi:pre-mRNA-splicing factor SYF2
MPSESAESSSSSAKPANDIQSRLFNLQLKINQGRKANKVEVEEEYKRFTQPKYENKQRYNEKMAELAEEATKEGDEKAEGGKAPKQPIKVDPKVALLQQTAVEAEQVREKNLKKEAQKATFGWQAFTADAKFNAYEKKLKKLPSHAAVRTDGTAGENIIEHGINNKVSSYGLDRLQKDIVDKQLAMQKHSKRRAHVDAADVDYINDKNAAFNKKLKKSFDKYTVEIRQNLERGTAV